MESTLLSKWIWIFMYKHSQITPSYTNGQNTLANKFSAGLPTGVGKAAKSGATAGWFLTTRTGCTTQTSSAHSHDVVYMGHHHEVHSEHTATVTPDWDHPQLPVDSIAKSPYILHGLAQDCSNSSANALELLQSCAKTLIWTRWRLRDHQGSAGWLPILGQVLLDILKNKNAKHIIIGSGNGL